MLLSILLEGYFDGFFSVFLRVFSVRVNIRKDRIDCSKESGGGLLIEIKNSFHYKTFTLKNHPKDLEYIAVRVGKQ